MSNLHEVRSLILQNSDNPDELRERWAREGRESSQAVKEALKGSIATKNILSRLVDEKVSEISAKQQAILDAQRTAEQRQIADRNRTLNTAFRKLIDADVATVDGGFLHFELDGSEYRVYQSAGDWLLESGAEVTKIQGDSADMLHKLAATIAKLRAKV